MTDSNEKVLNDLFKDRLEEAGAKLKSKGTDEIVVIVDRSGSMGGIREEAQGGINGFIEEQKKLGDAKLTIVEFDSYITVACDQENIQEAKEYTLLPRGMTALLDAIGTVISDKEKYETKDGKTIVVVMTDGFENCSKEYTRDNIFSLMKEREKAGWEFLFLAAGQDAIAVGESYGFSGDKTISFANSGNGVKRASETMSLYTSTVRCASADVAISAKSAYVNMNLDTLSEVGEVGEGTTPKDKE